MATDLTPLDVDAQVEQDLPSQYRVTSVLQFVQALASGFQATNDVVLQWAGSYDLDTAVGLQLDALGERLGQPRAGGRYPDGEADSIYRRKVRAAILRNRSGGTVTDLIDTIKALLSGLGPVVYYNPLYPAGMTLTVTTTTALTADERQVLVDFVRATKAAGVAVVLYVASSPTFAYATFPQPPFAGYNNGYWAHVFRL